MRELALFAGAGGGLLGSRRLGWRAVCACELDPFARGVLLHRQRTGDLERFPIWDDVRTFSGRPWRGRVDIVSGGFPCQPFSSAARGRNVAADLWPDMLRVVRECAPSFVFAENVQRDPILRAAKDLADLGFTCRYAQVTAADVGAPHVRSRWWIVAHSDGNCESVGAFNAKAPLLQGSPGSPWRSEPRRVVRVANGLACRMDRKRMHVIGNGQVPDAMVAAWSLLA